MRSITQKTANALKSSTEAAYDAVGGTVQAADLLGVGSPVLSKYASTSAQWSESFIRVDLALDLDRRSQHPFILTTYAREAGYKLIKDDTAAADMALTPMGILRLDQILSDVVRELTAALADGRIDAFEKRAIRKRIAYAKVLLAQIDTMMQVDELEGGGA